MVFAAYSVPMGFVPAAKAADPVVVPAAEAVAVAGEEGLVLGLSAGAAAAAAAAALLVVVEATSGSGGGTAHGE